MPIRTIVVDDHAVVREGIARLLAAEHDIDVLATFGDGRDALRYALREAPGIAVIDIEMPQLNGIELVRRLHEQCPDVRSLVLSMHANPTYVAQALHAGAHGYVLKESAGAEVIDAVRAVHQGRSYFGRKVRALMRKGSHGRALVGDPLARLSARELQVLRMVVDGMTSAAIARQLGLSTKSVETYRSRMMAKLEIESVAALVKLAIRHHLTGTG